MPRRRRRRRRRRVRARRNMGARACAVEQGNVLRCEPVGFLSAATAFGSADLWESTESEADGIDVFEVEDEWEEY